MTDLIIGMIQVAASEFARGRKLLSAAKAKALGSDSYLVYNKALKAARELSKEG
jgi:hypothetical protein